MRRAERGRWSVRVGGIGAGILVGVIVALAPSAARAEARFDVPPALRHRVEFWTDVFATYGERQVLVHDSKHLDRVYSVLDFRDLEGRDLSKAKIEQIVKKTVEREKKRLQRMFSRLDRLGPKAKNLSVEELRIRRLFKSETSSRKFQRAAQESRMRAQRGLRERFREGIAIGHRYFPQMEAIFRAEGAPVALTRLPLVESSFDGRAHSKAGAVGIWQFMPATARKFMRIDAAVDERLDPFVSARGAARFLRQNYERLGTWPLAIIAYNHGPAGIARAVRKLGTTDVSRIIERYRSRSFRFASRNFYPEFLAALEVEENHRDYFGPIALQQPRKTDVVRLDHYLPMKTVVRCGGHNASEIAALNPGLLPTVHQGRQRVPRRYRLRLAAGAGEPFKRCYAKLPAQEMFSTQKRLYVMHRVRRGQTLWQIARKYGSTVEAIRRRNRLRNSNLIRVGQKLRIPTS